MVGSHTIVGKDRPRVESAAWNLPGGVRRVGCPVRASGRCVEAWGMSKWPRRCRMRDETTPEAAGGPSRGAGGRLPLRAVVGVLLLASAGTLWVALALPTVFFQSVAGPEELYSIFGGVETLWEDGDLVPAVVVFAFSILFPVAKLLFLAAVGLRSGPASARNARLHRLFVVVGKWSFVDVLLIALFVGCFLKSPLASSSSRAGIHLFAFAILLSMIAAHVAANAAGGGEPAGAPRASRWFRLRGLLSVASLVLLLLGLREAFFRIQAPGLLSLLPVAKTEVAPVSMVRDLREGAEAPLALFVGLFAVVTPLLRAVAGISLALVRRSSLRRLADRLDEWAMLDVFALALALVYDKLAELTDTTLLPGFWVLVAAGSVGALDALLIRLDREPERPSGARSS